MAKGPEKQYFFSGFRLDAEEKMLFRGEEQLSLPPKAMDLLCLLAEREGKTVSKNELMDAVWKDAFVEESNLNQTVYTLRRILGNDESGKTIIETLPRRGFRLAAPIREGVFAEGADGPIAPALSIPARKQFPGKAAWLLGGLLAIALAGLGIIYFYPRPNDSGAPVENVSLKKLTFSGDISRPVISPDGKSIAYIKDESIFLQDINTGSSIRLSIAGHQVFGNLQFSLNGEMIYFRNEPHSDASGDYFEVSRFGGAARKLFENSWSGIGLSPDGRKFSFVRFFPDEAKWALFIRDRESGEEKAIFEKKTPESILRIGFPAFSPDSRKIVTVAQEKPGSAIYIIDAETGQAEKQPTPKLVQVEQTIWMPGGKEIVLAGRENDRFFQLWKMAIPGGGPQRLTNDLNIYRHISLSADGKTLLAENQAFFSHLWIAPADAPENRRQLTSGNLNRDGQTGLEWTLGGELLYASRITGNVDLWSLKPEDGRPLQLTRDAGAVNENLDISPDGKHIYFESNRAGGHHIWRAGLNGENPEQVTFSEQDKEESPALSPDGKWLYYLKIAPEGYSIKRKALPDGNEENIPAGPGNSPFSFLSVSPDGKYLAFRNALKKKEKEALEGRSEIGLIALEGGQLLRVLPIPVPVSGFRWAPGAEGSGFFYYSENTPEGGKLWRRGISPDSEPKLILNIPGLSLLNFAWGPDGKQLAMALGKRTSDAILIGNF